MRDLNPRPLSTLRHSLAMASLVIGAEACFTLPFLVPRIFRPTILDTFGLTNYEFGTAVSLYGIVAIFSYLMGGPLADRFSARALMASSLLASATGGLWFASIPSLAVIKGLYVFWGVSTILLFWAALIRATREWGGDTAQGMAFGVLDGGRGLLAALLGSGGAIVFASLLPEDATSASLEQRAEALRRVIWLFTGFVVMSAVMVWLCVPPGSVRSSRREAKPAHVFSVLKNRAVWLQSIIVLCAYVAYKGLDDFGLFARDAIGFDDVRSARIGLLALWTRPVAALGVGLLADRFGSKWVLPACFFGILVGNLVVAMGWLTPSTPWAFYMTVAGTAAMVYGLRGIYFALYREARVPKEVTGTATGIVSVVGYTPDVFVAPMMGYFTDGWPGALGHQYLFGVLALFAAAGGFATVLFRRTTESRRSGPATNAPV